MPKPLPDGPTQWEVASLTPPFSANAALQVLTAMADFNGKLCENVGQLSAEWVGFLTKRVKENWTTAQRATACTGPQDLQQVYIDYWSKAFAQYQEEFSRLAKLGELVTRETATALQRQAEAITSDTRLAA